jgi:hypothetical protein
VSCFVSSLSRHGGPPGVVRDWVAKVEEIGLVVVEVEKQRGSIVAPQDLCQWPCRTNEWSCAFCGAACRRTTVTRMCLCERGRYVHGVVTVSLCLCLCLSLSLFVSLCLSLSLSPSLPLSLSRVCLMSCAQVRRRSVAVRLVGQHEGAGLHALGPSHQQRRWPRRGCAWLGPRWLEQRIWER